jgi:ubiquinone/menaquinone biosynthesis C-methylase UbiE
VSVVKKVALLAGVSVVGAALWWRKNPSACPYNQRFWLQAPHPFITRDRLLTALAPQTGERILEIGPGTGYYTLDVARALLPDGILDIFDLQQEMLDHTMQEVEKAGLSNVVSRQGDARDLPYESSSFDGVFLVTVLGEIPDQPGALSEIRRVLKPSGRVVVGELFGDPHMVAFKTLEREATDAGLVMEGRWGPIFGFFARLRPSA